MTPDYWHNAARLLSRRDPVLRKLVKAYPEANLRSRGNAFSTLARSITGQQISVKAAQSVWDRVVVAAEKIAPENILAMKDEDLRGCGLSRQKVAYIKDLARHFDDGRIKPHRWTHEDDDTVIRELVEVKGIGRWTAEMYLMFYLLRPNVLPLDDIGLQRAMERLYNEGAALSKDEMREIAKHWHPWCTVATWYLWRSLDPVPVEY
jgi:3-methyladenine DNA glycosylase/8-oxoguanine DNA glycosylase